MITDSLTNTFTLIGHDIGHLLNLTKVRPKGILGKATLAQETFTTIYTVPAGKVAKCTINICATNNKGALVRLALSNTANPVVSDWIEYDRTAWSPIRTDVIIEEGVRIVGYANDTGVNITVWGYEAEISA